MRPFLPTYEPFSLADNVDGPFIGRPADGAGANGGVDRVGGQTGDHGGSGNGKAPQPEAAAGAAAALGAATAPGTVG